MHELDGLDALAKAKKQEDDEAAKGKPTQRELLIEIAKTAELWHTQDFEPWATVDYDGHREHWPVKSSGFRRWLEATYYAQHESGPSSQAMTDARNTIAAMACYSGQQYAVYTRVGKAQGCVYVDLANDAWEAVEVTATGWRVISDPPVRFRRGRGMAPLPYPVADGDIEELRPFVNLPDDEQWVLAASWLVTALRPTGPYPVLILQGEQGSAKSTTARVLRSLVDPSSVSLRTAPRNEQDLAIHANNAWVVSLDNLSGVPVWLSDAICRVATGGGFATRELYTDGEEALFDYQRPVILNGIDDVATRHDLADRSLNLVLPPIPDAERKTEATFWRDWELVRPRVFGALLDGVSTALRRVDSVHLPRKPRMADFAVWATAAEPAFGWPEGAALKAYAENRAEAVELGIESDAVAFTVCELLKHKPDGFEGTMTELLDELEDHASDKMRNAKTWPGSARSLSNRLRRSSTALRQVGIDIEYCRDMRRRTVRIAALDNACKVASLPSSSSSSEKTPQPSGKSHDAKHDASVFGDGVCVIHDKGMTQHDASMTQGNKVASSEKPHNKGVSGGHDANDVDDAGMQVLSFAKDEATTDRAAHNMPLDNACISSSASSTSSEGAPKGLNNGVSASDATSDANPPSNILASETSSDGKSPSLCGLRGMSDATDATDARKHTLSAAQENKTLEVFEL
jgi:hypothetical protein